MMKGTPLVRSDSAPSTSASRPLTMMAAGSVISSWLVPGMKPRNGSPETK